jgi:hypothetical protein
MADLDKLPYLDNVVRETLRVHAPVPSTVREAAHDVHIPVSKSFKDRYGVAQTHITYVPLFWPYLRRSERFLLVFEKEMAFSFLFFP